MAMTPKLPARDRRVPFGRAVRGRHRRPDADLTRLDAAGADQPFPGRGVDDTAESQHRRGCAGGVGTRASARRQAQAQGTWWELPLLVGVAILIAVLVKTFVVQPFYIPRSRWRRRCTGALAARRPILVNKPIYDLRDPHPGDIVVFHAPPAGTTRSRRSREQPRLKAVRGFGS